MSLELRQTIRGVESQYSALTQERVRAQREYSSALAAVSPFFDKQYVDQKRSRLNRMDEELARLNERLAALRKQLPDDEAVATAKRTADTQRFHVDAAVQRFKESGDRFLQRLELADSAGREFIAAKNEVVAVCAALRNLVDRYGLDIDVPTPPVRPQRDERLALNIAAALADLAAGDVPREVVEAYLAAERNERERTLTQV